jgi:SAM-dependent methyltransferase
MRFPESPSVPVSQFELVALQSAVNYRAALLREFSHHLRGRVIEIGAGAGQFTVMLRAVPAIAVLLSIEPHAEFCRGIPLSGAGHYLVTGTIDSVRGDRGWDAIFSVNVLEHIEADERELGIYRALLASNRGVLCLFVPARPEIYAPLDRDFGHHRRYTRAVLRQKLEKAGFEIVRLDYFNSAGYFAWWFTFCVLKRRKFSPAAVRFYDRAVFPVVYWLESHLTAPPLGQSLIAVARATP